MVLSELHDRAPVHSWAASKEQIEKAFGKPVEELFDRIDHKALASGSIAQARSSHLLLSHACTPHCGAALLYWCYFNWFLMSRSQTFDFQLRTRYNTMHQCCEEVSSGSLALIACKNKAIEIICVLELCWAGSQGGAAAGGAAEASCGEGAPPGRCQEHRHRFPAAEASGGRGLLRSLPEEPLPQGVPCAILCQYDSSGMSTECLAGKMLAAARLQISVPQLQVACFCH